MISYAISSYCGSYIPKDESTCDKFTNSTSICCYLQGNFDGAPHSLCYPFERDFYYSLSRTVSLNSFRYKLNCGQKRGALCGQVVNPVTYKDCSIFSKSKNSCCFYTYKKYLGVWRSHRAFRSQSFKQKPLKRIFATITNSKSNPKKLHSCELYCSKKERRMSAHE